MYIYYITVGTARRDWPSDGWEWFTVGGACAEPTHSLVGGLPLWRGGAALSGKNVPRPPYVHALFTHRTTAAAAAPPACTPKSSRTRTAPCARVFRKELSQHFYPRRRRWRSTRGPVRAVQTPPHAHCVSARYSCILFCTHDDGVRALNVRGDDDDGTPFHTSVPTAFFPRSFFLNCFSHFFFFFSFIFAAFRILNATFFVCGQYKFKKQPQTSRSRAACITYLTRPVTYIAHVVDSYNTIPAYRIDQQQSSVIAQANKS